MYMTQTTKASTRAPWTYPPAPIGLGVGLGLGFCFGSDLSFGVFSGLGFDRDESLGPGLDLEWSFVSGSG